MESMLEMNGGGVAVLDYDGDLRPDLFFTEGGSLPPAPFDPVPFATAGALILAGIALGAGYLDEQRRR